MDSIQPLVAEPRLMVASASSVLVEAWDQNGPIYPATAFLIEHGGGRFLVTARHVVTGLDNFTRRCYANRIPTLLKVWILDPQEGKPIYWRSIDLPLIGSGRKWFGHPGNNIDVAVIPFPAELALVHALKLDSALPLFDPSDRVSIVGFPFSAPGFPTMPTWSSGYVAQDPDFPYRYQFAESELFPETLKLVDLPAFLVDSRTRPGQSGSPVFLNSSSGQAVWRDGSITQIPKGHKQLYLAGVYSGRTNKESDLGMVWRAELIREILDSSLSESAAF